MVSSAIMCFVFFFGKAEERYRTKAALPIRAATPGKEAVKAGAGLLPRECRCLLSAERMSTRIVSVMNKRPQHFRARAIGRNYLEIWPGGLGFCGELFLLDISERVRQHPLGVSRAAAFLEILQQN
jgi:hypothetical protein